MAAVPKVFACMAGPLPGSPGTLLPTGDTQGSGSRLQCVPAWLCSREERQWLLSHGELRFGAVGIWDGDLMVQELWQPHLPPWGFAFQADSLQQTGHFSAKNNPLGNKLGPKHFNWEKARLFVKLKTSFLFCL